METNCKNNHIYNINYSFYYALRMPNLKNFKPVLIYVL